MLHVYKKRLPYLKGLFILLNVYGACLHLCKCTWVPGAFREGPGKYVRIKVTDVCEQSQGTGSLILSSAKATTVHYS